MDGNLVSSKLNELANKSQLAHSIWRSYSRSFQLGYVEKDEVDVAYENWKDLNRDYQLARKAAGLPYVEVQES